MFDSTRVHRNDLGVFRKLDFGISRESALSCTRRNGERHPGAVMAKKKSSNTNRKKRSAHGPSLDEVRTFALSLPQVVEQGHWGRPSFRVKGKIFMTLWPEEDRAVLKFTPDQQDEWVEAREGMFTPVHGTWGLQGHTFMTLGGKDAIDGKTVKTAVVLAWRNVAPKRLVQSFDVGTLK